VIGKPDGEKDGKSFQNSSNWFTPGLSPENLALKEQLNNGGFIVIGKDQDGPVVCGSPDYPAYSVGGEVKGGKAPKDRRGIDHQMQAPSPFPPVRLAAGLAIPLTPAA
jgi:hypothetical protein